MMMEKKPEVISKRKTIHLIHDIVCVVAQTDHSTKHLFDTEDLCEYFLSKPLVDNFELTLHEIKSFIMSRGYIEQMDVHVEKEKIGYVYRFLESKWIVQGKTNGYAA